MGLSFQEYAVSERVVAYEYVKNGGGEEKLSFGMEDHW